VEALPATKNADTIQGGNFSSLRQCNIVFLGIIHKGLQQRQGRDWLKCEQLWTGGVIRCANYYI